MTPAGELDAAFRESLAELDEYLDGLPEERLTEPCCRSRLAGSCPRAGSISSTYGTTRSLVQATPLSEACSPPGQVRAESGYSTIDQPIPQLRNSLPFKLRLALVQ
jgi:hypothetical protein